MSQVTERRPEDKNMSEEQKQFWLDGSSNNNSQIQKKFSANFTLKESQWL